jgi:mono/diheme cytochrome c family protein
LNHKTGLITGTPTATDSTRAYTIKASGPGGTGETHVGICVAIDNAHPCLADVQPPLFAFTRGYMWGTTDTTFADTPYSIGGTITGYSITPSLPAGMTFNSATGVIGGKPTAANGPWDFKVIATGPFGSDTESLPIRVYSNSFPLTLVRKGEERWAGSCAGCHGSSHGEGSGGGGAPPHYNSDYLMADTHRGMRIEMHGVPNFADTAPSITVNGIVYSSSMNVTSSDSGIAEILTFIRGTLNGATDYIRPEDVKAQRDSLIGICPQVHQKFLLHQTQWDCDTTNWSNGAGS